MQQVATREIMWNVGSLPNVIALYSLLAVTSIIFCWGIYKRVSLYMLGTGKNFSPKELTFKDLKNKLVQLRDILSQKKVKKDKVAKIFHSLIFYGFIVLFITTTVVFIDHDLGIDIYEGFFYLLLTVGSDVFGLGVILGIGLAYKRRYKEKPEKLHNYKSVDIMLGLIVLMCVQGFILEGIRIYVTDDPWKFYSPVGYVFSLVYMPFSHEAASTIHYLTWWFHTITVFFFIAIIPYTGFWHIFSSSSNLILQDDNRRKGTLKEIGDVEKIIEEAMEKDEDELSLGALNLLDFSWKELLDMDACTSCGRCQDLCPAYNSGKPLSPKWLIQDNKNFLNALASNGSIESKSSNKIVSSLNAIDNKITQNISFDSAQHKERCQTPFEDAKPDTPIMGGIQDPDVFWSCTTCGACEEVCPVGIKHIDHIMEARRGSALMLGDIPQEAQASLRAIENRGNPFGPKEERTNWAEGLDIKIVKNGDEVDVLYWVGCISAYDKRKQSIAKAMVKILNSSGLDWGILGNEESCSGDPARRLGEENLYQTQAKKNIKTLGGVTFNKIVANCAHCFNTLKNEYGELEGAQTNFSPEDIIHHSVFIESLIEEGKLKVNSKEIEGLTYHDPCYVGRHNNTYEAPRNVISSCSKGESGNCCISEMSMNKEEGLCCGAGGGHFWMDLKIGERVNVQRVQQAMDIEAKEIATSCPFCMQMLEDGTKLKDVEEEITVRDIAEIVANNL